MSLQLNGFSVAGSVGSTDVIYYSQGGIEKQLPVGTLITGLLALLGAGLPAGKYLRSNGSTFLAAGIQASDVPTLNQNTTGSAATVTGASQTAITAVGTLLALAVSGALNLTGANAPLQFNGNPGAVGQIPVSQGPGATPVWQTIASTTPYNAFSALGVLAFLNQ